MRAFLRWLITPKRTPIDIAIAMFLGWAVARGFDSSPWISLAVIAVLMGAGQLIRWVLGLPLKQRRTPE